MRIQNRELLIKIYEERTCACGRYFYVSKFGNKKRSRPSGIRPRQAVTCSIECGKKHTIKVNKEIYLKNRERIIAEKKQERREKRLR
jgi:hypothetical protein